LNESSPIKKEDSFKINYLKIKSLFYDQFNKT